MNCSCRFDKHLFCDAQNSKEFNNTQNTDIVGWQTLLLSQLLHMPRANNAHKLPNKKDPSAEGNPSLRAETDSDSNSQTTSADAVPRLLSDSDGNFQ